MLVLGGALQVLQVVTQGLVSGPGIERYEGRGLKPKSVEVISFASATYLEWKGRLDRNVLDPSAVLHLALGYV